MLSALLAALLLGPTASPPLELEGRPAEVERLRPLVAPALARIEARLGPVDWRGIRVRITTTREEGLASRAPDWAAAYAIPGSGLAVLRMDRIGSYPHSSLEQVLLHELTHIAVHRLRGDGDVPRWFDEGLCMSVAGEMGPADMYHLSLALVFGPDLSFPALDDRFQEGPDEAAAAYALAQSFVRWLERHHGEDLGRRLLVRLRAGEDFETAVVHETGLSLIELDASWNRRTQFTYRWLPILSSTVTLWIGISLLALVAWYRKRAQLEAQRLAWEVAEDLLERAELPVRPEPAPDRKAPPPGGPAPRPFVRRVNTTRDSLERASDDDLIGPYGPH